MNSLKLLFATLIIICLFSNSYSQNKPSELNELKFNYGAVSTEQMALLLLTISGGTTIGGIFNESVKDIDGSFTGPVILQYRRGFSDSHFAVGGTFGYSSASTDVTYESNPDKKFNFDLSYYIIMLEGEYRYINDKSFKLYSTIGLGADIISPSGNDSKGNSTPVLAIPAFQITPVGIDFGLENFGGSLELGFGTKGIISGGIYARF